MSLDAITDKKVFVYIMEKCMSKMRWTLCPLLSTLMLATLAVAGHGFETCDPARGGVYDPRRGRWTGESSAQAQFGQGRRPRSR